MTVNPIPDGYHTVTPYLLVKNIAGLLDYMKQVFGAKETERMPGPEGTIMHAEVRLGDSVIMMGEQPGEMEQMPGTLYVYVEDVDAVYKRAMEAGGTSVSEPTDQFYGDRSAGVKDPFGNAWWLATHVEDVSPEEMQKRAAAESAKG